MTSNWQLVELLLGQWQTFAWVAFQLALPSLVQLKIKSIDIFSMQISKDQQ